MQTRYTVILHGNQELVRTSLKTEDIAIQTVKSLGEEHHFIIKETLEPDLHDYPHSKWKEDKVYGRKWLHDLE